jgi:AcrR family transcriptional regulator
VSTDFLIEDETDCQGPVEPAHAQRSDARRNRLRGLEAGWRLLAERGVEGLNMEEVAREAEIGKGTLYRHFPTRDSLIEALLHEGAGRVEAEMRDRIPSDADAPSKLRCFVGLMYDAYEGWYFSPELLRAAATVLHGETGPSHPFTGVAARIRAIIDQGIREGSFRKVDVEYAAIAALTMINPFALTKAQARLGYDRPKMEERAVDFLLHALAAR